MAKTRTLAEMRADARTRADAVNSTNTDDSEANIWINQKLAELWGMLVAASPTRYMVTIQLTTASGVREYDFTDAGAFSPTAADFMSILGVDYLEGRDVIPLDRFDFHDRATLRYPRLDVYHNAVVRYDVRGQGQSGTLTRLVFDQDPVPGATYQVHYVPCAPELAADASTFDGVNGWEDWVVLSVAILMMLREESDTTDLRIELAGIENKIKALAARRDVGRSKQVTSVWTRGRNRHRCL